MTSQVTVVEFPRGGPAFGLTMELGRAGDDPRSASACEALWACPSVDGPWLDTASLGDISRRDLVSSQGAAIKNTYGFLHVGNVIEPIPFSASLITDLGPAASENGAVDSYLVPSADRSDWLSLDIPITVLNGFYPVDGSWTVSSQPWLMDLCAAFADIADHVHSRVPICAAAIGEEISGSWRHPTHSRKKNAFQSYPPSALMSAEVVEERGGVLLPRDLWDELLPKAQPIALSSGLLYVTPRFNAPLLGA